MVSPDPQFARSAVLQAFNHDQIYLILGAVITTIGLIPAFFSLMRRRFEPLAFWFALFAVLYGVRLLMNHQLFWDLGLRPLLFHRILSFIGFLVPIPAFFFFRSLNLLGRSGYVLSLVIPPILGLIAVLTLVFGTRDLFGILNNAVVTVSLTLVVVALIRIDRGTPDITLIRRGTMVFIVCALYDNMSGLLHQYDKIPYFNLEPFSFVVMLGSLGVVAGRRAYAGEQRFRVIQKELEIAKEIQLSILPSSFPDSKNFRVAARYLPMTTIAGDFYDFFLTSDHELGLLIADVSGHGVPAALIASMVKLAATAQRIHSDSPATLLLGMNTALCGHTQSQFVTAAYVYLNAASQELRYAAAAHPPMILLRRGEVTEITENGLMLASFDFSTYASVTHRLEPGDRLVLYTDGILEATNAALEEFGADRLHALVREGASLTHTEAVDCIIASVQQWSATQSDDLTVLLCDYVA